MRGHAILLLIVLASTGCSNGPRVPDLEDGLTHFPVDLDSLFAAESIGSTNLRPYFNYANTSHAEGPRKWYLYGDKNKALKVYLPARARMSAWCVRESWDTHKDEVNGETVHTNVNLTMPVSDQVRMFFMHLCLRDAIRRKIEAADDVVLEAGTHLGYVWYPPWNSLDFGINDSRVDNGLTTDKTHWWNTRVNPLDYFTPAMQERILAAYESTHERLREEGRTAFSDLTDSRSSTAVKDTIWGVWFKADLDDPFSQHRVNWSIINLVRRDHLHTKTFWKTLEEHPKLVGLMTENGQGSSVGKTLYPGRPMGRGRLTQVSGDDSAGVARLDHLSDRERPAIYLRYRVIPHRADTALDDELVIAGFGSSAEATAATSISERAAAVRFRREP